MYERKITIFFYLWISVLLIQNTGINHLMSHIAMLNAALLRKPLWIHEGRVSMQA